MSNLSVVSLCLVQTLSILLKDKDKDGSLPSNGIFSSV